MEKWQMTYSRNAAFYHDFYADGGGGKQLRSAQKFLSVLSSFVYHDYSFFYNFANKAYFYKVY